MVGTGGVGMMSHSCWQHPRASPVVRGNSCQGDAGSPYQETADLEPPPGLFGGKGREGAVCGFSEGKHLERF